MPMKLNVGLSKKVGEPNYGSRGASVNLELELDGTLVTQPDRMRQHVRDLFGLAREAVEEELRNGEASTRDLAGAAETRSGNGHHRNGQNGRRATQSQVRALHAITRRQQVDLAGLVRERFGVNQPEELSLRDASDLIDELNGSASGNGSPR